jgi:hypothetical protein
MQPGETITPGQTPVPQQPTEQPQPQPAVPAPPTPNSLPEPSAQPQAAAPEPPVQPAATPPPQEPSQPQPQDASWKFNPNDTSQESFDAGPPPAPSVNPVSWTASEYIQHHKNVGWYLLAGVAVIVLTIIVYFVTRDVVSSAVIGVAGLAFAVFGARSPRVLDYTVDGTGVHIGQKFYPYGNFKSFSVQEEEATRSILLMPTQRVGLPITIYYDPKDEDEIVEVLGSNLPHEPREVSAIDKFMRKIRF